MFIDTVFIVKSLPLSRAGLRQDCRPVKTTASAYGPAAMALRAPFLGPLAVLTRARIGDYEHAFPRPGERLLAGGAVPIDLVGETRWYHFGGYKLQFESGDVYRLSLNPTRSPSLSSWLLASESA
jgi:hypothetical protein